MILWVVIAAMFLTTVFKPATPVTSNDVLLIGIFILSAVEIQMWIERRSNRSEEPR